MVRSGAISLDVHRFRMMLEFPSFQVKRSSRGRWIEWEGYLRPMLLSKAYLVRIRYDFKERPIVTLPDESFEKKPPHTFEDNSLCLYNTKGIGAWNPKKSISELVPLISHWIWCYELWLSSGETQWFGEEYPHDQEETKDSN